jgi:hypothetical protein
MTEVVAEVLAVGGGTFGAVCPGTAPLLAGKC